MVARVKIMQNAVSRYNGAASQRLLIRTEHHVANLTMQGVPLKYASAAQLTIRHSVVVKASGCLTLSKQSRYACHEPVLPNRHLKLGRLAGSSFIK